MARSFTHEPGFTRKLSRDPQAIAALEVAARAAATVARRNAPGKTGRWIRTRRTVNGAEVFFASSFGHLIEFGSVKNPAYAPIRRAVRALPGLRFGEAGKG